MSWREPAGFISLDMHPRRQEQMGHLIRLQARAEGRQLPHNVLVHFPTQRVEGAA